MATTCGGSSLLGTLALCISKKWADTVSPGIIGLHNVALPLPECGAGSQIIVVAEHMPGDTSASYTSPW